MPDDRREAKPQLDRPAGDRGPRPVAASPMWRRQVRAVLTLPFGELRVESPVAFAFWVLIVIVVFGAGKRAAAPAAYYYASVPAVCFCLLLYLAWLELKGVLRFRVAFLRRRRLGVLRGGFRRHAAGDERPLGPRRAPAEREAVLDPDGQARHGSK